MTLYMFKCKTCSNESVISDSVPREIEFEGGSVKVRQEFCYLGDTVSSSGGVDKAISTRVSAWRKFRKLLPLLTCRTIALSTKGRMFDACIRSVW